MGEVLEVIEDGVVDGEIATTANPDAAIVGDMDGFEAMVA